MFPDVGSMMVSPGLSSPCFSASSTILSPILSFTLPPALKNSHFATEILVFETIFKARIGVKNMYRTGLYIVSIFMILTHFTFYSFRFVDLIYANQGRVSNVV